MSCVKSAKILNKKKMLYLRTVHLLFFFKKKPNQSFIFSLFPFKTCWANAFDRCKLGLKILSSLVVPFCTFPFINCFPSFVCEVMTFFLSFPLHTVELTSILALQYLVLSKNILHTYGAISIWVHASPADGIFSLLSKCLATDDW